MITEFSEKDYEYGPTTHFRIFDDVTEAIEKCQRTPCSAICTWERSDRVGYYFPVWKAVLDKCQEAHTETVEQVESMIEELEGSDIPQPMVHKRRPRFRDNDGDEIDLDRLRGGQDYWRVCERQATVGSQIKTIIVNLSTSINVDVDDIHWRGAAAITLCHLLEAAGYQCEIWGVHTVSECYNNKDGHFHAIKLKDCYGSIDIDSLSTTVSGWFYRTIWFALKERPELRLSGIKDGLGEPRSISPNHLQHLAGSISTAPEDTIIIEDLFSRWSAVNKVKRVLGMYAEPDREEEEYDEPVDVLQETKEPEPAPKPKTFAERQAERREEERQRKQSEKEYREWKKAYEKTNREN